MLVQPNAHQDEGQTTQGSQNCAQCTLSAVVWLYIQFKLHMAAILQNGSLDKKNWSDMIAFPNVGKQL